MKYRKLKVGEYIKKGDEYYNSHWQWVQTRYRLKDKVLVGICEIGCYRRPSYNKRKPSLKRRNHKVATGVPQNVG
jgi:hypothetical protein